MERDKLAEKLKTGVPVSRMIHDVNETALADLTHHLEKMVASSHSFNRVQLGVLENEDELCYLERMSVEIASHLQKKKKLGQLADTSRKRVVEKQPRSFFFSTKKKVAKRENWRNPTAEVKAEIMDNLNEIVVID